MEFRYKKTNLIWFFLFLILGIWFMGSYVSEILTGSFHMERGVIGFIAFFFTGLMGFLFCTNRFKAVIKVSDEGIAYKNKSEVFIRWEDVQSAEVSFISRFSIVLKDSFVITIKSSKDEIVVGSEIKNVVDLVTFIKSKLGNKIDTKEIPIEYKNKQR
jgi:hypothetical protein